MGRGMDAERLVQLRVDDEGAWVLTGRQLPQVPSRSELSAWRDHPPAPAVAIARVLRTELLDEIRRS